MRVLPPFEKFCLILDSFVWFTFILTLFRSRAQKEDREKDWRWEFRSNQSTKLVDTHLMRKTRCIVVHQDEGLWQMTANEMPSSIYRVLARILSVRQRGRSLSHKN